MFYGNNVPQAKNYMFLRFLQIIKRKGLYFDCLDTFVPKFRLFPILGAQKTCHRKIRHRCDSFKGKLVHYVACFMKIKFASKKLQVFALSLNHQTKRGIIMVDLTHFSPNLGYFPSCVHS